VTVRAEALAVEALAAWLRLKLPAKVAEVNATRAAVLTTPIAGPFNVPNGAIAKVSFTAKGAATYSVALAAGAARTAAQVASELNTAIGSSVAAADADGRLVYTSPTAPTDGTPSIVSLGEDSTGANTALGFDAGGEYVINTALVAPGHRGVMDGWPQQLDAGRSFFVVIGKRTAAPVDRSAGERRDEQVVTLDLTLFRPAVQQENHRSREHISACAQCVREVLKTDAGLQLGRASTGDIVKVEVGQVAVEAMRFQPLQKGKPFGPALDSATMRLYVLVFERPAST
jgi:hypothetical protein